MASVRCAHLPACVFLVKNRTWLRIRVRSTLVVTASHPILNCASFSLPVWGLSLGLLQRRNFQILPQSGEAQSPSLWSEDLRLLLTCSFNCSPYSSQPMSLYPAPRVPGAANSRIWGGSQYELDCCQLFPLPVLNSSLLPYSSFQFSKFWCCQALSHFFCPCGVYISKKHPLSFVLGKCWESTKEESLCLESSLLGKVTFFFYVFSVPPRVTEVTLYSEMVHSFTQDCHLLFVIWSLFACFCLGFGGICAF